MEMNKHHAAHHATHHNAHMEHAISEEKLDAVSGGTGSTMEIEGLQPLKPETDLKVILKSDKAEGEQGTITVEPSKGMIL